MAEQLSITSRRGLLGGIAAAGAATALVATPVVTSDRHLWDHRLIEYRLWHGVDDASHAFGPSAKAQEDWAHAKFTLEQTYGSWAKVLADPAGKIAKADAMRVCDDAESAAFRAFGEPCYHAAIALVRTPAPDVDAALMKVEIIREHSLADCGDMQPEEPFQIVRADMMRLLGGLI